MKKTTLKRWIPEVGDEVMVRDVPLPLPSGQRDWKFNGEMRILSWNKFIVESVDRTMDNLESYNIRINSHWYSWAPEWLMPFNKKKYQKMIKDEILELENLLITGLTKSNQSFFAKWVKARVSSTCKPSAPFLIPEKSLFSDLNIMKQYLGGKIGKEIKIDRKMYDVISFVNSSYATLVGLNKNYNCDNACPVVFLLGTNGKSCGAFNCMVPLNTKSSLSSNKIIYSEGCGMMPNINAEEIAKAIYLMSKNSYQLNGLCKIGAFNPNSYNGEGYERTFCFDRKHPIMLIRVSYGHLGIETDRATTHPYKVI